jgi:hypothetical protein
MKIVDSLVPLVPKLWIIYVGLTVLLFQSRVSLGIFNFIDRRFGLTVFGSHKVMELLWFILLYLLVLLTAEWFKARNIKKQGLGDRG